MKLSLAFALAVVIILPSIADAQSPRRGAQPGFATLDRSSTESRFRADLSLMTFDDNLGDAEALGLTLHSGFFFSPTFGGYATLPLTHVIIDDVEDESALGNIEAGMMFAPTPTGDVRFLARAGVALPTADDEDFAATLNAFSRVTDLVLFVPDIASIRLSGSVLGGSGQLFWRADAGLDIPIDTNDDEGFDSDLDPLIRLNVGGGIQTTSVALMGELASVGTTGDTSDGEDRFLYTFAFSARLTSAGSVQPMIGIATPLSDDLQDFIDFTFFAGLSAPIGR